MSTDTDTEKDESLGWLDELKGPPTWIQLQRIVPMDVVKKATNLSDEALALNHSDKIKHLSAKRKGMTLAGVLAIINGE
jgi:hypothetical protein